MRRSKSSSWDMAGPNTSRASWAVIPRPFAWDWRSWKARTTWTRGVPEKRGWRQAVDRDRPGGTEANFHKVLEDHTAGDPMRADVKWTNLSRRQIANKLAELGTPVSRDVVSQLLRKHRYRRRKAQKKKTMGPRHPDRNAQFDNIARLKKEYLEAGWPVITASIPRRRSCWATSTATARSTRRRRSRPTTTISPARGPVR